MRIIGNQNGAYSGKDIILFLSIIAVFFILLLPRIDNSPPTPDDASVYISLGSNIITGQGYRNTFIPEDHSHCKYPFVFPLLLGAVIYVWGHNYYIMRLMQLLLFLFSLVTIYILIKRKTESFTAYVITLLTAMSFFVLRHIFFIYSEMAYIFFSTLSLIFVDRYASSKKTFSPSFILASFFIICAFFTRIIGLSLIFATCAFLFFEREDAKAHPASLQKFFVMSAIILLPVFLWFLREHLICKTAVFTYVRESMEWHCKMGGLFLGSARNLYGMIFCGFPSLISSIEIEHRSVIGFLLSFIMLWGLAGKIAKKRTIVEYYFGAYLCILLFFFATFYCKRMYVPIAPFIFYYFIEGISSLTDKLSTLPFLSYCKQFKEIIILLILLYGVFRVNTFLFFKFT